MTSALPAPHWGGLLTQWTVQPVAIVAVLGLLAWYARAVRRAGGWPRRRLLSFAAGLVLFVWATSGFLEVYRRSLFWTWTSQQLVLWLIVPVLLLAGGPLQLARDDSLLLRTVRSRPCRVLGNPLVGPALVPVLSGLIFFGAVPDWAVRAPAFAWTLQLLLVVAGALIALPLVGLDDRASSLAVGVSLAVGTIELVLDAIPGIIMRLSDSLVTPYFTHRVQHAWTPSALKDQQLAAAILWGLAELIDLPFLLLVYRRWLRADARDAETVDTVLDAERIAGGRERATARDEPWWLNDPQLQERFRRQG